MLLKAMDDTPEALSSLTIEPAQAKPSNDADAQNSSLTLRFCVTADTRFGESIVLSGSTSILGSFSPKAAVAMSFESPGVWTIQLEQLRCAEPLQYKYGLKASQQDGGHIKWESGSARKLNLDLRPLKGDYLVRDEWRSKPDASREIFSTAAFTDVIFRRPLDDREGAKVAAARDSIALSKALVFGRGAYVARFSVFAERVLLGHEVCVCGSSETLGNDSVEDAVALSDVESPVWTGAVPMPAGATDVSYRFLIRDKETKKLVVQDARERKLQLNEDDQKFLALKTGVAPIVLAPSECSLAYPTRWKGAGVALPVFSIRSATSCGVGEFNDLPKLVDFCVAAGYQLLQLLPINDTTSNNNYRDSYPYSAVSSFALHPQYINIEALGTMSPEMQEEYEADRKRLNSLDKIDYMKVIDVKLRYIRRMYKLQKNEFLESKEFTSWFEENQNWLVPYAAFRFLMEVNGSSNYDQWGARKSITPSAICDLAAPDTFHFDYFGVAYYTQFHLHKQLSAAAQYAAEHQVVFKGDLPIGVNRYCVDTWVNPHLFRLDMQAGAPPDFFSAHGQNWEFPTYDWDAMSKDNYAWWRSRLGHMSNFFHAYRIDHILGFFRIWEIPAQFRTGNCGRFFPAHPITRQELESLGLWDIDRYVKPYVRDGILQQTFQDEWWKVKDQFFEPLWNDRLQFKPEVDTERKIDQFFPISEDTSDSQRQHNTDMRNKFSQLFNNVCLVVDMEQPDVFHPRFMMQTTSSYAELPNDWKAALYSLHEQYFLRRQDDLWKKNGLERLPMMKSASNMLVCGEDLGLIPNCVPSVMEETSILSLAVQRMPAGDADFGVPSEYKYECVATTSSHDTSTFRGWWEEIPTDQRRKYWTQLMKRDGKGPPEECTPEILEWAVTDHLASPAMWTIFPLQDLLGMDSQLRREDAATEQINDPSNPDHIWCFRLHLDIETILEKKEFLQHLAQLNKTHRRGAAY